MPSSHEDLAVPHGNRFRIRCLCGGAFIGIALLPVLLVVTVCTRDNEPVTDVIEGHLVDASHPYLQWSHGRVVRNATEMRFAWVGSRLHLRFLNSSSVHVVLRSHAAFNAYVDDHLTLLQCNASYPVSYQLASGLDPSVSHNVTLVLRSESKMSLPVTVALRDTPTIFSRFELDPGAGVLPVTARPTPPPSKLLVVGDSISTGWGNTGTCCGQPGGRSEPCAMDATRSYGALAADELEMEVQIIASGGGGWGVGNKSGIDWTELPMNRQFFLALPFDDASPVNLSSYVPDVVVFNVGTNDHDVPVAEWTRIYVSVLQMLRDAWPRAHFLLACAPMIRREEDLAAVRRSFEDPSGRTHGLDFGTEVDVGGCFGHPSLQGHAAMAKTLVEAVRKLKNMTNTSSSAP